MLSKQIGNLLGSKISTLSVHIAKFFSKYDFEKDKSIPSALKAQDSMVREGRKKSQETKGI